MEAAAPTLVPGFEHLPGNHCGSTALRNLLAFGGVEVSEDMALGLGAGVSFYYVRIDGSSPSRLTNGRAARLEDQFIELTGLPLRLQTFEDPESSWEAARAVVDSGRPAILLTDLYYLDHYGRSAHFPGHAVVLAGYDGERAYLSDTGFPELQTTSLQSLSEARHGDHPIFPLRGHMISVPEGEPLGDPRGAVPAAVARAAAQMLDSPLGDLEGLAALRIFAREVGGWHSEVPDWRWCARFCYQVIERRGTGGGNFRLMYSRFLAEAGFEPEARLAARGAAAWTELAGALLAASEPEEPEPELWQPVAERAAAVLEIEEELWPALADRAAEAGAAPG